MLLLSAFMALLILVVPALGSEEQDDIVIIGADAVSTRDVDAFTLPVPLEPRFIQERVDAINLVEIQAVPPELPLVLEPRFIMERVDRIATREIHSIPGGMPTELQPRFILVGADTIRQVDWVYPCELVGEPHDPVISELQVADIQNTQANITWMTDEYTDGLVEYGLASGIYSWTAYEEEYGTSHSFTLSGLMSGTRYYYRVSSTDRCANTSTSEESWFVTTGTDTVAPVISNVRATDITEDAATIRWTTNEPATSLVECGVVSGVYTMTESNGVHVTEHALELTGLISVTTHYYQVTSADAAENDATSDEYSFRTLGEYVYLPLILREH